MLQPSPLKWAGGKLRVLPHLLPLLNKRPSDRLVEPFLGSGVVALNAPQKELYLSDNNRDIFLFHHFVKEFGEGFIKDVERLFIPENNHNAKYLDFRLEFNETIDDWRKAVLFVYLNKHCFNGLCRYNKKGRFNVPFGSYAKPNPPSESMRCLHQRYNQGRVTILHQPFELALEQVEEKDTVYLDPPYSPLEASSSFVSYTVDGFTHDDHKAYMKLLEAFKGGLIISNHDTPVTRELYTGLTLKTIKVKRTISRDKNKRIEVPELLAYRNLD